jgi:hypothetical protein
MISRSMTIAGTSNESSEKREETKESGGKECFGHGETEDTSSK